MRSSLHSLLLFYRTDHLPLISVLAFPLRTLLGPCAGSPCIYTMTYPVLLPNLNLLDSPWISLSRRTTPECTLPCKPSSLNSSKQPTVAWSCCGSPQRPFALEDALQGSPGLSLSSLCLSLPELSVTGMHECRDDLCLLMYRFDAQRRSEEMG